MWRCSCFGGLCGRLLTNTCLNLPPSLNLPSSCWPSFCIHRNGFNCLRWHGHDRRSSLLIILTGFDRACARVHRIDILVLSGGCQVVVRGPSSRDATTQEFSRFGLIKKLSLVARLVTMSQIRVSNLNFITTQIGKTLVSSRPGWTVVVQPLDNHLTMSIWYAYVHEFGRPNNLKNPGG